MNKRQMHSLDHWTKLLTADQFKRLYAPETVNEKKVKALWTKFNIERDSQTLKELKEALKAWYVEMDGSADVADIVNGLDS